MIAGRPEQRWWVSRVREGDADRRICDWPAEDWVPAPGRPSRVERELIYWTEDYWKQWDQREEGERLAEYVERLLPYELYFAERSNTLREHGCHTLALLVGLSPEPLLQLIGVLEPTRVVLLLNRKYDLVRAGKIVPQDGAERGRDVAGWINRLLLPRMGRQVQVDITLPLPDEMEVDPDQPGAIFRRLCAHVLPKPGSVPAGINDIVVDITGAKKSMDVGAFLFAAYAGIPVSYVDFDRYHPGKRRPYGYTCRIGLLDNPYETFALRRWEEVRQFYEKYHFRAARMALREVLPVMRQPLGSEGPPLFDPSQMKAAERLRRVLAFYEAWDDGSYAKARRLLPTLQRWWPGFVPPVAVQYLATHWKMLAQSPPHRHARVRLDADLFMSNVLLLTYARDELGKIGRLIEMNEDYRSALLRAAGLDELLLKARWVRLWEKDLVETGTETRPDLLDDIVNYQGPPTYMRQALQRVRKSRLVTFDVRSYSLTPKSTIANMPIFSPDPEGLTDLRNQAIHKYQHISKKDAERARRLAEENLAEFAAGRQWLGLARDKDDTLPEGPGQPEWKDLRDLCGLDFLPLGLR